jgi:tRNA (cytidine/uridine-2'-O-)-methyltransferase
MFDVVLFEPEIPPNTGNLMRLVANTGNVLHLIHPLGFELSDRRLRSYQPGDALLFGPESVGLPPSVLGRDYIDRWLRIPMLPQSRSLNLSNAAAIVVYEAWRQNGFSTPAV